MDAALLQGLTRAFVPFAIPQKWALKTTPDMPPEDERIVTLGEHYDAEHGCTVEHTFHIVTPCLFWCGWNDGKGHGKYRDNGKGVFVHRRSWELANGRTLADDEVVDHLCRRPQCWNPTHLEAVTVAVNTARGLGRFYQYKMAKQYG